MSIFIYNSLTRKKEPFQPLNPPQVNIYTCGVTVYDECHIGHARSLYVFDVIRRYLKYRGFVVNFVRNITDIDDKIINRANELKTNWLDIVNKFTARYYEDLKILGIPKADFEPRATENIQDMIKHIKGLIDKGFAYEAGGDVYFSVRKFADYGKLSNQSIDQMQESVRIEPSEFKKDHLDFALWKKSKEGEPSWDSPWGGGRPGWHIECSTMSMKFLKTQTLDIHAGGRDLIFPHHENEIAQAEALTGRPFAKYWLHHGLLTINGQKMAKSLGNFVKIEDFVDKYNDTNILKLFFLSTHYSHPMDYTDEKIQEAKQALERIFILIEKIDRKFPPQSVADPPRFLAGKVSAKGGFAFGEKGKKLKVKQNKQIEEIKTKFINAMDDDFNMPQGLAVIFELVNLTNKNIDDLNFIYEAKNLLFELLDLFGLDLKKARGFEKPQGEISALINKRDEARKSGNFKEADRIRKELEKQGIILEDTKEGTQWRKKI